VVERFGNEPEIDFAPINKKNAKKAAKINFVMNGNYGLYRFIVGGVKYLQGRSDHQI